jgi:glycosyltransferase involved in cell wall biosynthesis
MMALIMKKKPHIAMILPDRIEHPVGGLGVQAKYLIKHLEHDFEFSVHGFPDETSLAYYHGVPNLLPKIQHGGLNTLICQVSYLASIMSMVESGIRPDIIHVADYTEYLAGIYASRILKVPLVVSMQLSTHLMNQVDLWNARVPNSPDGMAIENSMKEMEILGLKEAYHIIHVSNVYKKIFSEIHELDKKSTYIPNGVELEEFNIHRNGFKKVTLPGTGRLKIIFIGRFAPQKNIGALLQASIPKDIDLIFVGEKDSGPQEIFSALIKKCQQEDNLHYYGPAYGQEKINILMSADAVIIPSKHECHPIVMHEAMASGCVVIHSGAGDMKEILTDDFTLNCGTTADTITETLDRFLNLDQNEIERRKKVGLEVVKEYTWDIAGQKTKEVYLQTLLL